MIDTITDAKEPSAGKRSLADEPILRPEARVMRADRSLAAMVLVICTLGGMGVGFGFAMYLMRAQLAYAPMCGSAAESADLAPGQTFLGVRYWPNKRFAPLVDKVLSDTAAEQAGVHRGDILLSLGGRDLRTMDLREAVAEHSPGDLVPVGVMRGGQRMILYARLGFF